MLSVMQLWRVPDTDEADSSNALNSNVMWQRPTLACTRLPLADARSEM